MKMTTGLKNEIKVARAKIIVKYEAAEKVAQLRKEQNERIVYGTINGEVYLTACVRDIDAHTHIGIAMRHVSDQPNKKKALQIARGRCDKAQRIYNSTGRVIAGNTKYSTKFYGIAHDDFLAQLKRRIIEGGKLGHIEVNASLLEAINDKA